MGGSEQEFVARAFASNYIAPVGPMVDAFEREFAAKTGIPHAVAVASGTAAMHLALKLIGVGPGDEVFGSTLTFIGSISPAVFLGARPVFIDCDRATWCMDPELLSTELERCAGLGKLPKAVVPTDLYGQCADYARIRAACGRYGVPVVVDAAEAMGASYNGRSAGAGAAAAVFSFNGNKIITTSGGGMLAADDRELIEKARFLSQQARDPFPHYEHSEIGFNYRMSNIVAAIGLGQLEVLEERVARKRRIFDSYRERLQGVPGIEFMPEAPYGRANRWLTVVLITPEVFGADREDVRLALEAENIESRPVWKPMHLQPVFTNAAADRVASRAVGGTVAEDLFGRGLCLPSGTAMTEADIDRVVSTLMLHKQHVKR
jgi:dTDP-4-amino-4,6-dideoxygalactose transaminase